MVIKTLIVNWNNEDNDDDDDDIMIIACEYITIQYVILYWMRNYGKDSHFSPIIQ